MIALGVDEYLLPLREYIASFGGDLLGESVAVGAGMGIEMGIEMVHLDMPMEMVMVQDGSFYQLLAAPPTQHLTTSIMPIFHRLRIRLEPT